MIYTPTAIKVENLFVVKGGGLSSKKAILQDINFTIEAGEFVAIVGPNGAGKTTLLRALVGEHPAAGSILLWKKDQHQKDYEELYDNPEFWLQQIGYVPVDNILHEELTVRQALTYIGRLRLSNIPYQEIEDRVESRLQEFGFIEGDVRLDRQVKNLSSGERKKVNICAELLTNPSLLLLDEPTSNLDPNAERDLMDDLRQLSEGDSKPTILLVTHTLSTLDRCDRVLFVQNSKLIANDTPGNVFQSLQKAADLKNSTSTSYPESRFETWAEIFDTYKTDEAIAQRTTNLPSSRGSISTPSQHRPLSRDSFWRQYYLLLTRYSLTRFNDLGGVILMLWAGFIAGFLLLIAPEKVFLEAGDATAARQTVVLYVILAIIMGAFTSHREISKEFRIYMHERSKGLKPFPYVMSKVTWLSVVMGVLVTMTILALTGIELARKMVLVLSVVVTVIGLLYLLSPRSHFHQQNRARKLLMLGRIGMLALPLLLAYFVQLQLKQMPDAPLSVTTVEVLIVTTMVITSIASITIGLLVSSVVGANNDNATQLVIGAVVINVILAFSVLIFTSNDFDWLFDTLEPLTASHWGYRGFSSSLGIYCWAGLYQIENYNSTGHLIATWLLLTVHIIVAISITVFALRLRETWSNFQRLLKLTFLNEHTVYVVGGIVILLSSWSYFLIQRSQEYFDLTYFDILYGASRYARVENSATDNDMKTLVGRISETYCGRSSDEYTYLDQ